MFHIDVSQGCNKIRSSESKKITKPLYKIKVALYIISIHIEFYQNRLINECTKKNLVKWGLIRLKSRPDL